MRSQSGIERIQAIFKRAQEEQRAALMPYLTLGYPSPEASLELVEAAVAGGADILELGIPFSDPLADGPIIQQATHTALQRGMTTAGCLDLVQQLRQRGQDIPFVLMGYYNPILAYGEEDFCRDSKKAGVDGLIVPDLPPEEGGTLERACRRHGLALVYLLAPTSSPERIQLVTKHSQGFVYLVSVTGTTGPRERLPPDLVHFVQRVRAATDKPLAVGFGISTPEQAGCVAAIADGVIVGSALVRRTAGVGGPREAQTFVASLRRAVASPDLPTLAG